MSNGFKSIANEFFETNRAEYDGRPLSPTTEESKEFFDAVTQVMTLAPSEQLLSEFISERNIISIIGNYATRSKLFLLTGTRVFLSKDDGDTTVHKNFIAAGIAKTKEELLDFISTEDYIRRITEVYYAIPIITQSSRIMFYKESVPYNTRMQAVPESSIGAELDL